MKKPDSDLSFSVDFDTIKANAYNLTITDYRENYAQSGWVPLGGDAGVCDLVIGGTPSTKDRRYYGGNNLWVNISDMTANDSMYISNTKKTITEAGVSNSSVKLIPKGTVLLSFKLSIGKVAIAGRDLYTNEAIAALVPKDGRVLPKYLYYILPRLNLSGQSGARKAAKGRTSSKGRLEKVLIPLPPLDATDYHQRNGAAGCRNCPAPGRNCMHCRRWSKNHRKICGTLKWPRESTR